MQYRCQRLKRLILLGSFSSRAISRGSGIRIGRLSSTWSTESFPTLSNNDAQCRPRRRRRPLDRHQLSMSICTPQRSPSTGTTGIRPSRLRRPYIWSRMQTPSSSDTIAPASPKGWVQIPSRSSINVVAAMSIILNALLGVEECCWYQCIDEVNIKRF